MIDGKCVVQIKVNDWVLVKTHPLSSAAQKLVAKFKLKCEGPYRVLEVKQNNLVVWRLGKRITVNVDQVRLYHHKKSYEMEIRTRSSDNNSSSYKSNNFEDMQPRSNESQYSRKNGSGEMLELEEKGTGFFKRRIRVRGTQVRPVIADHLSDHHLTLGQNQIERLKKVKRKLSHTRDHSSLGLEDQRKSIKNVQDIKLIKRTLTLSSSIDLPQCRKKFRTEETMMLSTSGCNLRPRRGAKVESQPANETRTQQGGLVRFRRSREKQQYSLYAEEQRRSISRNIRSRSGQQQHCQERKGGGNSYISHSLKVLI
ncbi:uncharacterized protein TNCV_1067231 [Trichonephila clavipes]|nr:uncharacterized protein TNCV_1067231 [Trichonephila clavipes]